MAEPATSTATGVAVATGAVTITGSALGQTDVLRGAAMSEPNDILIRFTKDANGKIVKAVEMGVNDDSLLPEMTKTADFITQCLAIQDKTDTEIEFNSALEVANKLAASSPRILPPH